MQAKHKNYYIYVFENKEVMKLVNLLGNCMHNTKMVGVFVCLIGASQQRSLLSSALLMWPYHCQIYHLVPGLAGLVVVHIPISSRECLNMQVCLGFGEAF